MVHIFLYLFVFLLSTFTLYAEKKKEPEEDIFDATQPAPYGSHTTHWITPYDLKYRIGGYQSVARDIARLHHFTFVQQQGNTVQDLGSNGTALHPIFYTLPTDIGLTSGFGAYDLYFPDPRTSPYYDTQSPYSYFYLVLANLGSFVFKTCFSQNITPLWNLGFNFQSIMADKEYTRYDERDNKNVISFPGFDVFTHFKTSQEQYQILARFCRMNHRVRETGGIGREKQNIPAGVYDKDRQKNTVFNEPFQNRFDRDEIESRDLRQQYYLYQQMQAYPQLYVYHELWLCNQFNRLETKLSDRKKLGLRQSVEKRSNVNRAGDSDEEHTSYCQRLGNEVGIQGDLASLFYGCYYRHARIKLAVPDRSATPLQHIEHEHYVGVMARHPLKNPLHLLQVEAEYLFRGPYMGFFKTQLGYQSPRGKIRYQCVQHKPSFLVQHYHSDYRSWQNSHFLPPKAQQIWGTVQWTWPRVFLAPGLRFTRINAPIVFEQTKAENLIQPQQDDKLRVSIFSLQTAGQVTLWPHIYWDTDVTFTLTFENKLTAKKKSLFGATAERPLWLVNTSIYYANTLYNKRLTLKTGVDMHWKDTHYPLDYDPVTQQFYYQQYDFPVHLYVVADVFINFRIKNFCAFFKISHINEGLTQPGYLVLPFYPGPRRAFDIGIDWSFFD